MMPVIIGTLDSVLRTSLGVPNMSGKTLVPLLIGQSGVIGRGTDTLPVDTTIVSNIKMMSDTETIIDAVEPINHDGNENASQAGYGFLVARELMARHNPDQIVMVGCGVGSTGFMDGSWQPSKGSSYNAAKARWTSSIAEIKSTYGSDVVVMVIWCQGEDEVQNYESLFDAVQDEGKHQAALQHLFYTIREVWPDIDHNTVFLTTTIPSTTYLTGFNSFDNIANDIENVSLVLGRVAYADMTGVTESYEDTVHFDMATFRQMGDPICDAYEDAHSNLNVPDHTAMNDTVDPDRASLEILFDARGLADNAVTWNLGVHKEFDNKRVKVENGTMVFDGDSEFRLRDNGKPYIRDDNFSIKFGLLHSTTAEAGIVSDWQSSGNQRSFVLRIRSGAFEFYGSSNGASSALMLTSSYTQNTFVEGEVRREGDDLELWLDGVLEDTYTLTSGYTFFETNITNSFLIGDHINNRELVGYISYISLELLN